MLLAEFLLLCGEIRFGVTIFYGVPGNGELFFLYWGELDFENPFFGGIGVVSVAPISISGFAFAKMVKELKE